MVKDGLYTQWYENGQIIRENVGGTPKK